MHRIFQKKNQNSRRGGNHLENTQGSGFLMEEKLPRNEFTLI